jgi:hypothetical protein
MLFYSAYNFIFELRLRITVLLTQIPRHKISMEHTTTQTTHHIKKNSIGGE